MSIEKVDALSCSNGKDTGVVGAGCERVQFAAADVALDGILNDRVAGAKIPPADFAVVGGCSKDVVVPIPDDRLNGAAVGPGADFIARC
jgi:ABC-type phosphate transport system substrate-binding protein